MDTWNKGWGLPDEGRGTAGGVQVEWLDLSRKEGMSEKQSGVLITAPQFGTGKETVGYFTGYACGYCKGNGYYLDPDIINERVKVPCPKCGGTGQVKGIVTVEWVPDGEVKSYFKEE